MKVILVRHGIAVDVGDQGVETDEDRMLSEEGRAKTRAAANGLKRAGCAPGRILSSPLVRAHDTAGILQKCLLPEGEVETADCLRAGAPAAGVLKWLQKQPAQEALMLVGHMPDLAEVASLFLTGGVSADIVLKKAGACAFTFAQEVGPGRGTMEWLLQSRHLRLIAG